MSLSTTIKSLQDIMRKDAGVDGDAQRIGQLGWLLFFKIYSDLELEAQIEDPDYVSPIPAGLQWAEWADQDALGKDAPTGDALLDLVENQLFLTFKNLDLDALTGKTRERGALLRGVYEDAFNYMKNGTLLRQVINNLNSDIDFNQSKTRHLFGDIYEQILKDLQSAGNAGEFYTPRAVTQFAVEMIDPQLGETVLDPACGTGGFLAHAYEHLKAQAKTPDDLYHVKDSIHGVEKKSLPHLLCVTNMMIHGIEVPSNVRHGNTLARPLRDYGKADQVDVIVTNPPFGGTEEDGIESNFPSEFRTRETADLFLVLVMELLKDGGRAAVVLPDGTLFGDGIKTRIKKKLLTECNLHTVVRLPAGVFAPYTPIRTNILFFTKGEPTSRTWFYEHPYPPSYKTYSKTKPIQIDEFEPEKSWWLSRSETKRAWRVEAAEIKLAHYNLDFPNPNTPKEIFVSPEDALGQHEVASKSLIAARETLSSLIAPSLRSGSSGAELAIENLDVLTHSTDSIATLRDVVVNLALRGRMTDRRDDDDCVDALIEQCSAAVKPSEQVDPFTPRDLPWAIPDSWRWVRFKQIVDFAPGKTPSTKDSTLWEDPDQGHAWASIADMPISGTLLSTARAISQKAVDDVMRRPPAQPGALLMSFKLTIGKVCRVGRPTYFNEAIIEIDAPRDVLAEFLFRTLPLLSQGGSSRAAIKGNTLNKKSISNIPIPLPPIAEQQRMIDTLDVISLQLDELESALLDQEAIAETFNQSVWHLALEP